MFVVAEKYQVALIADEIYEDMTFSQNKYTPLARLSPNVPILTCSGLAKRFLVPGWRFGWIAIHDAGHDLSEIRRGLFDLSGLIIGANTLIQAALPEFFEKTPATFYQNINQLLEANAEKVSQLLGQVDGLSVIKPQGTMYALVGLKPGFFDDDIEFSEKLLAEQSVSVLPGTVSLEKCSNFLLNFSRFSVQKDSFALCFVLRKKNLKKPAPESKNSVKNTQNSANKTGLPQCDRGVKKFSTVHHGSLDTLFNY